MPGARDNEFATGKDRRISFVEDRATWIDFSPGAMQRTGNPLDVAIDGKGYFVVQTPRGQRYTRNGALRINAAGQLVTSTGDQVLGTNGPISFKPTDRDIIISPTGVVSARDGAARRARSAANCRSSTSTSRSSCKRTALRRSWRRPTQRQNPAPQGTRVVQGAIEKSNVRPIVEMARMIEITRSYSDIAAILQQQGDLRRNSLQQLAQAPSSSS